MRYIKYDKLCRTHATWLLKVREWSLMRVSFLLATVAQKNRPLALGLDCASLFFRSPGFMLKLLVSLKQNQLELEIVKKKKEEKKRRWGCISSRIFSRSQQFSVALVTFKMENLCQIQTIKAVRCSVWLHGPELKRYDLPTVMSIQSLALFAGVRIHNCWVKFI